MSLGAYVLSGGDEDVVKRTSVAYGLSGQRGADAAEEAAAMQQQASRDAIGFQRETRDLLFDRQDPFIEFGTGLLPELKRLLDPQGQADFLQNSPLFQASLANTNNATMASRAAQGKLGSGGTLDALQSNFLVQGQPFLQQQISNLFGGVNLGQNTAVGQASQAQNNTNSIVDLMTGSANAGAAGLIGSANAQQQGAQNIAGLAAALFSAFSDRRLKRNVKCIGIEKGLPVYTFTYQWDPNTTYRGYMSDEVKAKYPHAVGSVDGYEFVIYGIL